MKFELELYTNGKPSGEKGDLSLEEITALGDSLIEKAIRESE